ncbi:MAG TPA: hypothetical protein VI279_12625 [Rhodocyclaceae bacterium]
MLDLHIPDLTFPMVKYGKQETRWDLRILLYRGASRANYKSVFNEISDGALGTPIIERIELVKRIHEAMTARLVGGGKRATAFGTFRRLREFFAWADDTDQSPSLETIEDTFFRWCDFLLHRCRLKVIDSATAYTAAVTVSSILDAALERSQPLIITTRLKRPKSKRRAVGVAADKQNLAETFAFGHLCLDVIDSLSFDAIFGTLPVPIRLRDTRSFELWSGLRSPAKVASLQAGYKNKAHTRKIREIRAAWGADRTLRTRHPLVNLRLEAELLVFIAQTGMNHSQAHQLRLTQFSYQSTIDGYSVRDYKERRKGEVLFEIFAEYRSVFENYLAWRDAVFSSESTDLLFPFVREGGAVDSTAPQFRTLRYDLCKRAGITFICPQKLRNTRVNWLLRQSRNPEQTAEQAQHNLQTLLRNYEKPSLQVALVEIIQFWKQNDPRLGGNPMPCLAPGVCDGVPAPLPDLPREAPKPDCTHPAGCLFCEHHRDIDTEDYVWSTASMQFLQTIILQRFRPTRKGQTDAGHHVELTLEVLTAKLKWFSGSNATRRAWVEEASEKVAEGDFHIHWRYLIESAQGV